MGGSITSVQAVYVPADDLTDPAPATTFAHLDATTVLSRGIAELGIYPAVDPLDWVAIRGCGRLPATPFCPSEDFVSASSSCLLTCSSSLRNISSASLHGLGSAKMFE